MPEGHILHRLAVDQRGLVDQVLTAGSPQGRFADGARALNDHRLKGVEAYGKHLYQHYDSGDGLHVHLGMQGKWFRLDASRPPRGQVRLRLSTGDVAWDLIAPSTCELLSPDQWSTLIRELGPDPLRDDADPEVAWSRLHAFGGAVGAALLDQAVLAGVGNVFRAEALFACGVHPGRPAAALSRTEFDQLWQTLTAMMNRAVVDNRIITVDAPAGASPPESESRMVYRQQVCRRCATPVQTSTIGGRTAYVCPVCQAG